MDISQVFENNKQWVAEKLKKDQDYFKNLAQGQNPDILYIGCSDSRATAEQLMGVDPGDVFVHRNIANVVPNTDLNALSVINYAVNQLSVEHIVVCGHYNCGGVKAAMQSDDQQTLNPWLCTIRDVARLHETELSEMDHEKARYDRLVELNVQEQCINLLKIACVQDAFLSNKLALHGWVFDIRSGKIIDLETDFDEIWKDFRDIYALS